jgi:hypothetical protein
LLATCRGYDDEIRIERSLEPEWLVAEALFWLCHRGLENDRLVSEILVGGVAGEVNQELQFRGKDIRLSAKKVGLVLKSLGVPTVRLGNLGRGLRLTDGLKRKIHELARQLGIDRRCITGIASPDYGYGGVPCPLCEEFGVTGGLRFVDLNRILVAKLRPSQRRLFDHPDDKENLASVRKQETRFNKSNMPHRAADEIVSGKSPQRNCAFATCSRWNTHAPLRRSRDT